ncbi:hypothetical protein IW261DRAFT_1426565 [Armillaria novae-zelandiae]|uniref:DEAD/DEAH-box helicase domain-containing protein n=1 Tax=Armillaria novae-zelandiae TaxID=153914 RepID=A0AA39NKR2_9AGAR|nr:hypothetical protein IW261DRAFT_1426565 [Armillaria novae-zelandiae]
MLPRHKQMNKGLTNKHHIALFHAKVSKLPNQKPLSAGDLLGLREKIHHCWGWTDQSLHDKQMEAIEAQLQCKDVLIHTLMGFGKTVVAAGPHMHEKMQGCVTLMISPLIALQEEQVQSFIEDYKLTATAVNSNHGGCTADTMKFCKMYGTLGLLCAFIPKSVSVVAMLATLSKHIQEDVISKLQFNKAAAGYITIDVGNNWSNVSLIVCAMQHAMNAYVNLDFVIPSEIEDHLTEILPANLQKIGIIQPYNATYSTEYRKEVMHLVKLGIGCNIPNIEVVIQWKLPSSMSVFVQQAGRAA